MVTAKQVQITQKQLQDHYHFANNAGEKKKA
jgi:hypothetical protein